MARSPTTVTTTWCKSTSYITSGIWRDADGKDRVGAVMIQNGQIFTARDVQKADARPGGYVAHGGHGGIIGNTVWDPVLSFIPTSSAPIVRS